MSTLYCVQSYKKNSPSSGLFRVKVYNDKGMAAHTGTGLFPRALMERLPLLPMEEEGRLNDLPLRENFIERVFAYYRWTEMLKTDPTPGGLVRFHTAHKLTLMAHPCLFGGAGSIKHYQELGRLVAQAGTLPWDELAATYGAKFMEGLALLGTRRKHVNARSVQHLLGYLKKELSSQDKQELLALIEDYRQELVPLIVPLTLLTHHLRRHEVPGWVWDAGAGRRAFAAVPEGADVEESCVALGLVGVELSLVPYLLQPKPQRTVVFG